MYEQGTSTKCQQICDKNKENSQETGPLKSALVIGTLIHNCVTFVLCLHSQLRARKERKKTRIEQKQEEVASILGLGERQKTFVEQQKKVRFPSFVALTKSTKQANNRLN